MLKVKNLCLCVFPWPGYKETCFFWGKTYINYIYIMNSLRRHYQQPICAALLVVPQGDYPELRIKAYAGRVLVAFLQDKVASLVITESQRSEGPGPSEVLLLTHGALSAICRWFLQVEAAQRYLTADEASEIYRTSLQLLFYANGGKTYLFSFPTN